MRHYRALLTLICRIVLLLASMLSLGIAHAEESKLGLKSELDVLAQEVLGRVTQAMHVDWRKHSLEIGINVGSQYEFNNFRTESKGVLLRVPGENLVWRLGLSQVDVKETGSSRELGKTRYRQWGRPSRYELRPGLAWPAIDAMTYPSQSWMPALQLSISGFAQLHYAYFPGTDSKSAFASVLTDDEKRRLEETAPTSMQIVDERYWLSWGFETVVYSRSGLWTYFDVGTSQWLLASKEIKASYEFALGMGYAF